MLPTIIEANSIPDAWFQCVYQLLKGEGKGVHAYKIDQGSYVGQTRFEFDFVVVEIERPWIRSLLPEFPEQLNLPPVADMAYVEEYLVNYLLTDARAENETYRYSNWIARGMERVRQHLRDGKNTNQATISVGGWLPNEESVSLEPGEDGMTKAMCFDSDAYTDAGTGETDPACLRLVDFRVDQENKLHMIVYFRSWDLWGGFPANLAGLQMMKELLAEEVGVEDGKIIAVSKGLHIYDHGFDVAAARVGLDTNKIDLEAFKEFISKAQK